MGDPIILKDHVTPATVQTLGKRLATAGKFDVKGFVKLATKDFDSLELKPRIEAIARALRSHLPQNYTKAINHILKALGPRENDNSETGWFLYWPLATFVELYGLENRLVSYGAMHDITQWASCEFAIRPFLAKHQREAIVVLGTWLNDPSDKVRRLISEGTRPRLPWGMQLKAFVQDPRPTVALISPLRLDESLFVRRSVANHLNDICKDHPEFVIETARAWKNADESRQDYTQKTGWILNHGLRTLVKAGNPDVFELMGYSGEDKTVAKGFKVAPNPLSMGESLSLDITLTNSGKTTANLVVDFAIHFVRPKGANRKVFKWKTVALAPGESTTLSKRHPVRPISTRRYYAGDHKIEVTANGKVMAESAFVLKL